MGGAYRTHNLRSFGGLAAPPVGIDPHKDNLFPPGRGCFIFGVLSSSSPSPLRSPVRGFVPAKKVKSSSGGIPSPRLLPANLPLGSKQEQLNGRWGSSCGTRGPGHVGVEVSPTPLAGKYASLMNPGEQSQLVGTRKSPLGHAPSPLLMNNGGRPAGCRCEAPPPKKEAYEYSAVAVMKSTRRARGRPRPARLR